MRVRLLALVFGLVGVGLGLGARWILALIYCAKRYVYLRNCRLLSAPSYLNLLILMIAYIGRTLPFHDFYGGSEPLIRSYGSKNSASSALMLLEATSVLSK